MIIDFGLIDIAYNEFYAFEKSDITDFKFTKTSFNEDSSETWICFLPWKTKIQEAKYLGLIPKKYRTIVYEGPVGLVSPNAQTAKDLQSIIAEDIDKLNLKTFNVLAYSVGTFLGSYIAKTFPIGRLISVVPGEKAGACIWDGIATQEIKEIAIAEYDIKNADQYDAILNGRNPIDNLENLPSDIEIHIASHDNYIRTHHGEKLIQELINANKNPRIYRYENKGHLLTLRDFGKNNIL